MDWIFLDTETTGLEPGQIIQLSLIVTDRDLKIKEARNSYFTATTMDPAAERIHGLSLERLRTLSGGATFFDSASELHWLLHEKRLIAHNIQFDLKFLNEEFRRAGLEFKPWSYFCTMKHFTPLCQLPSNRYGYKWPSLMELEYFLGIDTEEIRNLSRELFGDTGARHDARFDAAAVLLFYRKGREKGMILD